MPRSSENPAILSLNLPNVIQDTTILIHRTENGQLTLTGKPHSAFVCQYVEENSGNRCWSQWDNGGKMLLGTGYGAGMLREIRTYWRPVVFQ